MDYDGYRRANEGGAHRGWANRAYSCEGLFISVLQALLARLVRASGSKRCPASLTTGQRHSELKFDGEKRRRLGPSDTTRRVAYPHCKPKPAAPARAPRRQRTGLDIPSFPWAAI